MSSVFSAISVSSPSRPVRAWSTPFVLRAALLAGVIAAGFIACALAMRSTPADIEPQLGLLLRFMAVIKASIALAAISLALWRFGQPVSVMAAAGYVAGAACLVAATVLIWCLSFIAAAAIIFHVGLIGLLVLAWREGGSVWRLRSRRVEA